MTLSNTSRQSVRILLCVAKLFYVFFQWNVIFSLELFSINFLKNFFYLVITPTAKAKVFSSLFLKKTPLGDVCYGFGKRNSIKESFFSIYLWLFQNV